MSGLNVITDTIRAEAEDKARAIIKEAEEKSIIQAEAAKKEAETEVREIIAKAEKEAEIIKNAAKAAAVQELSKKVLKRKTEIISSVAEDTFKALCSEKDEKYFSILEKLLEKYADGKMRGEIVLNQRDKNRITSEFKFAAEKKGLEISAENGDFEGGFVLRYGKIEENCTFEGLFRDKEEEMTDYLSKKLFEKG